MPSYYLTVKFKGSSDVAAESLQHQIEQLVSSRIPSGSEVKTHLSKEWRTREPAQPARNKLSNQEIVDVVD